jgi:HEAT repeat protein
MIAMKWMKLFLALGVGITIISIGITGHTQPTISKDTISSDIPADVRAEIEGLYAADAATRAQAASHLGKMGARAIPAIPFLVKLLGDEQKVELYPGAHTTSPGQEARKALVKIGKPAVEHLLLALQDKDWLIRSGAAWVLGEIKDKRALEPLDKLMRTDKNIVVVPYYAAEALGKIDIERLIAALRDEDSRIREIAAEGLGRLKDARAVEPLLSALLDKKKEVRRAAAEALGKIKSPKAVKPLIDALQDTDGYVREHAALALGEIKDPGAVAPLIAALQHKDWATRWKAAWALGEIKDARAVEPLIVALQDKKAEVRHRAAWALGEIKDRRAIKPLIPLLDDEHVTVRMFAEEALVKITGKHYGHDSQAWLQWWEHNQDTLQKNR